MAAGVITSLPGSAERRYTETCQRCLGADPRGAAGVETVEVGVRQGHVSERRVVDQLGEEQALDAARVVGRDDAEAHGPLDILERVEGRYAKLGGDPLVHAPRGGVAERVGPRDDLAP